VWLCHALFFKGEYMANRNLKPIAGHLEKGVSIISKVVTFGVASISSQVGKGLSVARNGAGDYTITLEDVWPSLLGATVTFEAGTAVDLVPQLNNVALSSKTIGVKLLAAAVATEPATTTKLYITLILKNSTL
jgi:hypothetical protein